MENSYFEKLVALIESRAAGTLVPETAAQLGATLTDDLSARRLYLQRMFLIAELKCRFDPQVHQLKPVRSSQSPPRTPAAEESTNRFAVPVDASGEAGQASPPIPLFDLGDSVEPTAPFSLSSKPRPASKRSSRRGDNAFEMVVAAASALGRAIVSSTGKAAIVMVGVVAVAATVYFNRPKAPTGGGLDAVAVDPPVIERFPNPPAMPGTTISAPNELDQAILAETEINPVDEILSAIVVRYRLGEDDDPARPNETLPRHGKPLRGSNPIQYTQGAATEKTTLGNMVSERGILFGGQSGDYLEADAPLTETPEDWMLDVWVRPRTLKNSVVVFNGRPKREGFGLLLYEGKWAVALGNGFCMIEKEGSAVAGKWTRLTASKQGKTKDGRAKITLEINIVPVNPAKLQFGKGLLSRDPEKFCIGGCSIAPKLGFDGEIDEVVLLNLAHALEQPGRDRRNDENGGKR